MPPGDENGLGALAAFRLACEQPEPTAGVAGLLDYVDAGCAAREFSPLALDAAEFRARGSPPDPAQVRTVRERLGRLGYGIVEPHRTAPDEWTPGLAAALREFQRESGLPAHGQLEVSTWDRLRELFDFETALETEWCFVDGMPRPSLVRAARLRLSVLGLPAQNEDALGAWLGVQADLGARPATGHSTLTPAVAAELFDHDGLAARLAGVDTGRVAALPKARRAAVESLMVCTAKIELWLLGYEVAPDGDPVLRRRVRVGRPGAWRIQLEETSASTALRRFFEDTELEGVLRFAPESRLKAELPEFFRRARELRNGQEGGAPERASAEIVAGIERRMGADPDLWSRMRIAGARMANALFDGMRRVVAWVGRLLRGAAKAVARLFEDTWLGNLLRAVRYFAGAMALRVRKAARVFCSGVGFLFSANQASNPAGQAWAARGGDFNLRCVVDSGAEPAVVTAWADGLVVRARHLGLATAMISLVFGAVRRAALGLGSGPLGWLPLVLGMARLYSEARELGRALDAVPLEAETGGL